MSEFHTCSSYTIAVASLNIQCFAQNQYLSDQGNVISFIVCTLMIHVTAGMCTGGTVQLRYIIHAARLTLTNAVQELDLIIGND